MAETIPTPPKDMLDGAALFLDFDGTLVELAESPSAIRVAPSVPPLLRRLDSLLEGRLAIVSGRGLRDLQSHLDCNGIAVSGSHGLELRLRDGTDVRLASPTRLEEAREAARSFAAGREGVLFEDKPFSVALHYRKAPDEAGSVDAFLGGLAKKLGLAVQRGHMVVEVRPHGADKGDAVSAFMGEPPFAGSRPYFIGDDLTDEAAFEAAARLGGGGILVGPPRDTVASWRLADVGATIAWLEAAVEDGHA